MTVLLKDAIKPYGIPKRIFVDNGKPYKNMQLKSICASMGIALIHAKPYSPESKAKIEYIKVSTGTPNSLDFQLTSILGYKIAKEENQEY